MMSRSLWRDRPLPSARIKYTVGRVPQQDVLKAQIAVTRLADHLAMFLQDGRPRPRAPEHADGTRSGRLLLRLKAITVFRLRCRERDAASKSRSRHRPELKAIEAGIRQLETKVRLTEKNYKPDISVGAGYMLMPSGSMNRNGYMAELSFNLPWLNRSKHDAGNWRSAICR